MEIEYRQLNSKNFTNHSLDDFIRHQRVSECWRNVEGTWMLVPISFEENWSLEQCREIAADVAVHMEKDQTAFGAFDGEHLVGFVTVSHNFFGQMAKYLEPVCFQVSEPYRGKGIGKILFQQACEEAKRLGAEKLYISGHSSKESQAAYKALGCVHAREINRKLAEEEPFDVQLEYTLREDENERNVFGSSVACSRHPDAALRLYLWFHTAVDICSTGVGRRIWMYGCGFEFQKLER